MSVIEARQLRREFPGKPPILALEEATLAVRAGEKLAIYGPSGAGKSTLLNLLGLLDTPSAGSYSLLGQETKELSGRKKDRLRSNHIGFVFQNYQVMGHRQTWENIDLKLAILRMPKAKRGPLIDAALQAVGLQHRATALARNLSGGEKQRLAIARAIVHKPKLLLADEPTGNLDSENTVRILEIFDSLAANDIAVIAITHDEKTRNWADRSAEIRSGILTGGENTQ